MMPERNSTSTKVFTVRLGLGSVIFAALITFVGLAWIFFLGVMAGRMYYGAAPTTLAQSVSPSQQSTTSMTPPPSVVMPSKQTQTATEAPTQSKSITTYHPVIKDDNVAERVAQGQEPFPRNDFENMATPDSSNVVALGHEDTLNTIHDDTTMAPTTPVTTPATQNAEVNQESQDIDFIKKVDEEKSSSASTMELDTPSSNANTPSGIHIENNTTEKTPNSDATINTNQDITSTNQQIFDYTYQLATFKNPDSAHSITSDLVADGLNATVLTEERNGTMFHYIIIYHRGTEKSKEPLEKKLAQHNFTDFIVRSKIVP